MSRFRVSSSVLAALCLLSACGGATKPSDPGGERRLARREQLPDDGRPLDPDGGNRRRDGSRHLLGGVVSDLQCHPVSPAADLDNVGLLRVVHLSQQEVEIKIAAGQLAQSEIAGYLDYHTDHSAMCAKLSQLSFFGTLIDVQAEYAESTTTRTCCCSRRGRSPGIGARA